MGIQGAGTQSTSGWLLGTFSFFKTGQERSPKQGSAADTFGMSYIGGVNTFKRSLSVVDGHGTG